MQRQIDRWELVWHSLPVLALVIWGALCVTENLWYDEAFSAAMVSQPWYRMVYITAADDHSPFYYALLKVFYEFFQLFGAGFWSLKLMSLLFMMGYMLLGKYYVRRLFDRQVSVYFMFFSLMAPLMCGQAGNVRMYAVALFFMTLTGLLAYDLYKDATRRKWQLFGIASICTMYCHTFAMIQTFLFYLLFLGCLVHSKQRQKMKSFFICGFTVAAAFSPWLLVTVRQMVLRMRYDTGSVEERADLNSLVDYCREWFSALETPIDVAVLLGLGLALILGGLAVRWMRKQGNYAPAVGAGAFLLTALAGFLISVFINNCFLGRYAFPGFGFIMLLYAVGMCQIKGDKWKLAVAGVAFLCFLLQYQSELALEYDDGLETYEAFWEEQVTSEDVMIGPTFHSLFLSIYHPEIPYYLYGYESYKFPFPNTGALLDYSQLDNVAGNIWYVTFGEDTPDVMEDCYDCEEALRFDYMYYDFVLFRMTRKG